MADEGMKDHVMTFIVGGLLMFCLLLFAITFSYNNNSNALNDGTGSIFDKASNNISSRLISSSQDSNSLLNITSNTNPEVSNLGSRDSVAVSFESSSTPKYYWDTSKDLIKWVFSGTTGDILIGTFGGIIGFLTLFYIWRFIKTGI